MEDTILLCSMPIPGGCPKQAKEAILAYPSIDAAGPMAQWATHLRCGTEHTAEVAAKAIRTADPGATVLVFRSAGDLQDAGVYMAGLSHRMTA